MNETSSSKAPSSSPALMLGANHICSACGMPGADVKVMPCSSLFHVSCIPGHYFTKKSYATTSLSYTCNEESKTPCSSISCRSSSEKFITSATCSNTDTTTTETTNTNTTSNPTHTTLHLLPITIDTFHPTNKDLSEKSYETDRNKFLQSLAPIFPDQSTTDNDSPKEIIIDEDVQIRNGRWTAEEIRFVDALMKRFNEGSLLLPNGGSLNNFLRSMFLCKGTRLRKKIKNANFCTRLYNRSNTWVEAGLQQSGGQPPLSILQDKFIRSLDSEEDKKILSFGLKRMWTTHFFNFCIHTGFESIVAGDWLESLETIEKQVRSLKFQHQKFRRFNLASSMNAPTEGQGKPNGPLHQEFDRNVEDSFMGDFSADWDNLSVDDRTEFGLPLPPAIVPPAFEVKKADDYSVMSDMSDNFSPCGPKRKSSPCAILSGAADTGKTEDNDDQQYFAHKRKKANNSNNMLVRVPPFGSSNQTLSLCEQFGNWTPFIQKISNFIEGNKLPFQYFDVWYATNSSSKNGQSDSVVLRHVGHSALDDMESIWNLYHMNQFGEYSSNFAFSPGEGLPGRVIASGTPTWDDSIQKLNTHVFPRVQGARNHGVKKGLGIPMLHSSFGNVVIAMYSINDIPKDINLLQKCCNHFHLSYPRAKWELILEADSCAQQGPQKRDDDEAAITDLLSRHCSINDQCQPSFMSLRLLLLKEPSKRQSSDTSAIEMIKASFRDYSSSNKKDDGQIAALLVQEWSFIKGDQTTRAEGVTGVNYHGPFLQTTSQETPSPQSQTSTPNEEDSKPFSVSHTNYASQ